MLAHHRQLPSDNNNETSLEGGKFSAVRPSCRRTMSILMELPLQIMNGVSDLLNYRSTEIPSPDSEIPAKRPYSPRLHHNKQTPTDVSHGRGRGRGRSQLRRSGVSQTRHRQERIRQRLTADIRDDLEVFREFEDLPNDDELPNTSWIDKSGKPVRYSADDTEAETDSTRVHRHYPESTQTTTKGMSLRRRRRRRRRTQTTRFPLFFPYCVMKRRKQRQQNKRARKNGATTPNDFKVRYTPEFKKDFTVHNRSDIDKDLESDVHVGRKRLQSDRSVDSEDSCCIVFETGSESEFETDYDYATTDDDDEDDEPAHCRSESKVRFSPHPIIHTMVAWDYAYRAARRGPWEEMARDRDRFKCRINCIAQVLNPILVPHHRSKIWQHRFAVDI